MLTFLYWVFVIAVSLLATSVFAGFLYLFFPELFNFKEKPVDKYAQLDYTKVTKKPFKLRKPNE